MSSFRRVDRRSSSNHCGPVTGSRHKRVSTSCIEFLHSNLTVTKAYRTPPLVSGGASTCISSRRYRRDEGSTLKLCRHVTWMTTHVPGTKKSLSPAHQQRIHVTQWPIGRECVARAAVELHTVSTLAFFGNADHCRRNLPEQLHSC